MNVKETTDIIEHNGKPWEVTRICRCSDEYCETFTRTAISEAIVFGGGIATVAFVRDGVECSVTAEKWLW